MIKFDHIEIYSFSDDDNISYTFRGLAQAYTLLEKSINEKEKIIFLDHLWEGNILDGIHEVEKFVNLIKEKKPQWRIFLLLNTANEHLKDRINQINVDDVLFVDYFLYRCYREIILHQRSAIRNIFSFSESDHNKKNKFLFLTGYPDKLNRVGLLKKFVAANIMDQAEWSFHFNYLRKEHSYIKEDYFPEFSDAEFAAFIKTWTRNPDNLDTKANLGAGITYDVKLYALTDFSVVSESSFRQTPINSCPWITEKTWIPILNRHPFLMAGEVGTLAVLEKLGFNVFREFLKIKDYDTIINNQERLDAIVENTKHLLGTLTMSDEELKHAVDYNYNLLGRIYMSNLDRILNFMYKHNLENDLSIDDVVYTTGRNYKWISNNTKLSFKIFYNNIKGDEWPECETEEDFCKLPDHIKKECIDKFGYIPMVKENDGLS